MAKCITCIHAIPEDGAMNEITGVYEDVYRCRLLNGSDYFNVFYPHDYGCDKGFDSE